MLSILGLSRGVLVQGAAHGADNSAVLDALSRRPDVLRAVAVVREDVSTEELRRMDQLGVRGVRVNQKFNDGRKHLVAGMSLDAFERTAARFADLGWHLQLWIDARDLPEFLPRLRALPVPVVIDHMGYPRQGLDEPGFRALLRCLGEGGCWVKLSGAYRISEAWPDYEDAAIYHRALVAANPERLLWGTDWPHPRVLGRMPDTGRLLDAFNRWTPDADTRRRILVENPARLYGFPPAL
jgi:predicted TIM-barrel fold metal-dependent hydrolase